MADKDGQKHGEGKGGVTVEPDYPAQSNVLNPAFGAFGLTTEPWVYFVNSNGVVTDRFEGAIVYSQLEQAAAGTLAGHVPAVSLS